MKADPGPGYRLLERGEIIVKGDEFFSVVDGGDWRERTVAVGDAFDPRRHAVTRRYEKSSRSFQHNQAMSNKTFDPTKPVQTRDGRPARILCTDLKGVNGETIAAAVADGEIEFIYFYFLNGSCERRRASPCDLINLPEKREVWVNIYPNNGHGDTFYSTKEIADRAAGESRIACIKLEYEVPPQPVN